MKRSQIKRRPLADSVLENLEPEERDYQENDSPGLYFRVKAGGSKSWLVRYKRPNGKWAWKGIGGYPGLSGKGAREKARELLLKVSNGEDLTETKEVPKITFKDAAEHWYDRKVKSGRAPGTTRQMRLYLDNTVLPVLGSKAIDEVTRLDCTAIQQSMEDKGAHVMAGKLRGWINQIFSLAIAEGKTDNNPASELKHIAVDRYTKNHYPHLLEPELPDFLKALEATKTRFITRVMVWLALRTASRPGMARFAEWSEIDLDKGLWTITAEKMKMRRDHTIPLARQSLEDLKDLQQYTGHGRYLFPGYGSKHPTLSENTLNKVITQAGYGERVVGHGFRHTASTLLREHGWPKDWVEAQLAHVEDGMAGVYNKAQYLEQRRTMMQWYADYLDALRDGTSKPADPVIGVT
ncbi:tyrosine-type recombinase/integrase [Marinobacter shengliensis]|uniref:tyrosine-type recombinase/integrase n=1 Tax=Marinobacter shengliensis TaxID=1389223 RepID=UPI001E482B8A|nr:tyrosine-type recombinase/integrase [Marinobacter shengliensis]MCD1628512.1 tyrosine-type recombinase/integrase [Marinobacter shengliensis]